MKVLLTFQKIASFSISRNELSKIDTSRLHRILYIIKHILYGLLSGFGCAFLVIHLLFEAESFQEAADTLYPLLTLFLCSLMIPIFIWNGRKIFAFIDHFESIIEERKLV